MWVWKIPGKTSAKAGYFFDLEMIGSLIDPEWAKGQSDYGSAQCLRGY